jgi:CelD/BcsL family acetyltransferase involved in cellulose biosynthesis
MKVSVIAAHELDARLETRWKQMLHGNDSLRSPYYRPEFLQVVARSGGERLVQLAVLESGGEIHGFFPHETSRSGRMFSIGGGLNDYHGLIADRELQITPGDLLSACNARYFSFNHLPLTQTLFAPYVRWCSASPVMDVRGDWASYVSRLCEVQSTKSPGILTNVRTSERRLERDKGPIRFELNEPDASVLEWIMRLKSEQWQRTYGAASDAFAQSRVRKILYGCMDVRSADFKGVICSLYAGDQLVSAHFGLQTSRTLHYWFPVYDPDFAYYQPGLILLKKLAEQVSREGVEQIDLGRGLQSYKNRFKTGEIPLGEGAISRPAILAKSVMAAKAAKIHLKQSPSVIRLRAWLDSVRAGNTPKSAV